jgi:hypothetical protein
MRLLFFDKHFVILNENVSYRYIFFEIIIYFVNISIYILKKKGLNFHFE